MQLLPGRIPLASRGWGMPHKGHKDKITPIRKEWSCEEEFELLLRRAAAKLKAKPLVSVKKVSAA